MLIGKVAIQWLTIDGNRLNIFVMSTVIINYHFELIALILFSSIVDAL